VILLRDIDVKLSELRELIRGEVSHSYLLKYIQDPIVDEDKLLLLLTMLSDIRLDMTEVKNYVLPTMLVQIALDTHEYVTNAQVNTSLHMKNRQLTVLAGDYYSGLYYYFLARNDDVLMVRKLAEGIKDINEHKIILYRRDLDEMTELLNSVEIIEASLMRKMTDYFNVPLWNDFSSKFLLLKRLLKEKEIFIRRENSIFIEAMKDIFIKSSTFSNEPVGDHETHLINVLDKHINLLKNHLIQQYSKHATFHSLLEEKVKRLFFIEDFPLKKFLEEG